MSNYGIQGKLAIITGASSGIGFAIANSLASEGVNLLLISRNEGKLNEAAELINKSHNIEIKTLSGDVADKELPSKAKKMVNDSWGCCDILVNNAGGPPMGSFMTHSEDTWLEAYNTNFFSAVRFTKLFVDDMKGNKWGRILNVTSSLAKEPTPQMVLSASMRAALSSFTKAVSTELAPFGITLNNICPGGVLTERLKNLVKESAKNQGITYEEALKASQDSIPIGRFASPSEFADIATFMLSDKGRYLTGVSLMADGGLTKGIF